jgi:outer membrane protein OmpA-like peptidoglycan-associated protein
MNNPDAAIARISPAIPTVDRDRATRPGLPSALVLLVSLAALAGATPVARGQAGSTKSGGAEVMQQRDIERALSAPRTRGLRIAPRTETIAPDEPVQQGPSAAATGSASAAAAASIALDVPFEINSSALRPSAAAQLAQLAGALRSDELAPYRFLIAGHTDASGDATYNRRLSGRRADTVRRRLIDAGIDARRLDARGFGEDEPLDPAHPYAAANRRVEVRNLGVAAH